MATESVLPRMVSERSGWSLVGMSVRDWTPPNRSYSPVFVRPPAGAQWAAHGEVVPVLIRHVFGESVAHVAVSPVVGGDIDWEASSVVEIDGSSRALRIEIGGSGSDWVSEWRIPIVVNCGRNKGRLEIDGSLPIINVPEGKAGSVLMEFSRMPSALKDVEVEFDAQEESVSVALPASQVVRVAATTADGIPISPVWVYPIGAGAIVPMMLKENRLVVPKAVDGTMRIGAPGFESLDVTLQELLRGPVQLSHTTEGR